MITGIDFVALPVADMARAKAFYQDTLGLKPGHFFGEEWVEFDLGPGPALGLDAVPFDGKPVPAATGSVAIAFHDFEAMTETLRAKGHLTQDAFESPVCHAAFAVDSEGNSLSIHRRKGAPDRDRVLDFVMVPVENMARARAFYEAILGLTPPADPGDTWCEYVLADDSAFALGDVSSLGQAFAPVTSGTVGFATPDLEDVFAKLKGLGFAIADAPMESPVCWLGQVRDSEGNSLVLHRLK